MYRRPYFYNQPIILGIQLEKVTKILLIINCLVFLLELLSYRFWGDGFKFLFTHLALTPYRIIHDFEIWQLLTFFWLHSPSDLGHIIWNMLTLWFFGSPLERRWGNLNFLKFYLYCGIGSGITVLIVGYFLEPLTPTIGASGAILGLIVAFGILYPNLPIYLLGIFPIKGKTVAIITVGINFIILLMGTPGISVSAHFGGMAIGALLVTGIWKPTQWKLIYYRWKLKRIKKDTSIPPYYH